MVNLYHKIPYEISTISLIIHFNRLKEYNNNSIKSRNSSAEEREKSKRINVRK